MRRCRCANSIEIDAIEQTDHGVLQRIKQGCRILFSLAIFRHQALDKRAQLIGGGAGVEKPRRVRTALHDQQAHAK